MSNYDDEGLGAHNAPLSRDPSGSPVATQRPTPQPLYGGGQPMMHQPMQPMHQPMQQPMQPGYGYPAGYGMGYGMRPRRNYPIETKPFFLTSEFFAAAIAVAGIAITAASSDAFGAWRAWILISAITIGYLLSRGIAKSGTKSHADDPRENFDLSWGRGDGDR